MMFLGMLLGYSLVFAMLLAVACNEIQKKHYIWAKGVSSLSFLVVFGLSAYKSGAIYQFWLMLPAFFCCFAGDILMAAYNRFRKKIHFLMGLGIFLMGHLCFVRWLCKIQPLEWVNLVIPALAVVLTWGLTLLKKIHTGRLRPFILLYSFFVALFVSKGLHLVLTQFSIATLMIAVGSILFFVSDISILFLYFHKKKGYGVHIFNLATYYYGMFLLATHLLFR